MRDIHHRPVLRASPYGDTVIMHHSDCSYNPLLSIISYDLLIGRRLYCMSLTVIRSYSQVLEQNAALINVYKLV